jgi:O6-methylguanine-DNA--protein-cysteine methyltransferase
MEPLQVNKLIPLSDAYKAAERQLLQIALGKTTSLRKIAALLGTTHPTVGRLLKEHNVK